MHGTAIENGKFFFEKFVSGTGVIVDIGAQDINGSMRCIAPPGFSYIGVDCVAGKHVDVVAEDPYHIPLEEDFADVIVSTSTLEHVEFFWELFVEMVRIVKPAGLIYINAPSAGPYHECPVDCWRFYPGAGQALEKWSKKQGAGAELIYSHITEYTFMDNNTGEVISNDQWRDWVAVFRKL